MLWLPWKVPEPDATGVVPTDSTLGDGVSTMMWGRQGDPGYLLPENGPHLSVVYAFLEAVVSGAFRVAW